MNHEAFYPYLVRKVILMGYLWITGIRKQMGSSISIVPKKGISSML